MKRTSKITHARKVVRENRKASGYPRKTITVTVKNSLPAGWRRLDGAMTAPRGYYWASNGKSRFSGEYKHALIRDNKLCAKLEKDDKAHKAYKRAEKKARRK